MDPLGTIDEWPVRRVAATLVIDGDVRAVRGDLHEVFELASVTKLLTAMAVLVAHEEGTIDLDGEVTPDGATMADLLAHSGGVAPDSPQPMMPPRRRRIYSTAAYDLAAQHVADAAGMPFADYLVAAVTDPLGLTSTELGGGAGADARSSVSDLVRLEAAWRRPLLVHDTTLDRATRPHLPILEGVLPGYGRQTPNPWGLGPEIRGDKNPHWSAPENSPRTFGHFGRSGTLWWIDPDANRALVVLTDEPFGPWAIDRWPVLAADVLAG